MPQYIEKDLTTINSGIVAHGVNCSGAMNSGVARAIRNRWPLAYERFQKHPKGHAVLGQADIVYIPDEEIIVANCYTQVFYGYGGGKYADPGAIQKSLARVFQIANLHAYPVYIPKIGCGLGGLSWTKEVGPIIEQLEKDFDCVDVFVCDLPENKNEPDAARSG